MRSVAIECIDFSLLILLHRQNYLVQRCAFIHPKNTNHYGMNINGCIRGESSVLENKIQWVKWKITNRKQAQFLTMVDNNDLYSDISLFHTEGSTSG